MIKENNIIYAKFGVCEDNEAHYCIPTLDGRIHIVPKIVFTKIALGLMKLTELENWEIITKTIIAQWMNILELDDQ